MPQLHVDQRAVAVSIHAFRGEGDFGFAVIPFPLDVSIHAFRGEGDQRTATETAAPQRFNPRLPGGRRLWKTLKELKLTDVSIHAFRGEGDIGGVSQHSIEIKVSIHAFRGEGDVRSAAAPIALQVSIHAFRGEGDATAPPDAARPRRFNPRLPGGRRQQSGAVTTRSINVSIHAFRGEGDAAFLYVQIDVVEFQSTPSGGKATRRLGRYRRDRGVSIHAFRGEGDADAFLELRRHQVSIHAFRGEGDLPPPRRRRCAASFNPRLPGGRRLVYNNRTVARAVVSIHAFRGEGDAASRPDAARPRRFNPRLPGGRRPAPVPQRRRAADVSIHAFRGEGDISTAALPSGWRRNCICRLFQSTPSGGKATRAQQRKTKEDEVSIHAFRGEGDRGHPKPQHLRQRFNPRLPGGRRPTPRKP